MKRIALSISTLAAISLVFAGSASATTYTVTSTADESPAAADNGVCTLREAINMASTNSAAPADGDAACGAAGQTSADTINISATPILMIAAVGTDDNHDGDFDLIGPGGDLTINTAVAGGANAVLHGPVDDRVIDKLPGNSGLLTLNGITVQHGNAGPSGANAEGGGIRTQSGNLALTGGSLVQSNAASSRGGGVFVGGGASLTVNNATITNNSVELPAGLTAGVGGGGIALSGGGVANLTSATVSTNTVTRNQVGVAGQTVEGGGILDFNGRVNLTDSTISGNQINISGNSGPDQALGGGISALAVDIAGSTINDNRLTGGATRKGGGIYANNSSDPPVFTTRIHDTTFSNNGSTPSVASGGAIYANGGATVIRFTTFAFDDANTGGAVFFDDRGFGSTSFEFRTSIFSGEGCEDDDGGIVGPEITTAGDSVFDTSTGCPITVGDQTLSLSLNALANNGGSTSTHGLPLNTPLLNDIPLSRCNAALNLAPGISRDQRGFPRAVDGGCEAGAIEVMSCHGQAATILGTPSTDFIPTTPADDVVVTGNNNDTVQASAGNDTVCGDQGNLDTIDYSTAPGGGPAVVDLAAGTATLPGKSDSVIDTEQVFGTAAGDTLSGTDGNGEMRGNDGNDILNGRGGQDAMTGGADDGGIGDLIVFDNAPGGVTADLTNTATFQNTGNGNKLITGVESIRGGAFNDQLTGDGAANTINGAAGADTVHGGGGADTVTGGAGADSLFGEGGDDLMNALDGEVDTVDCGDGSDTVDGDATDVRVACELPAPSGETPSGEAPPGETPPGETPPGETPPATDTKAPALTLSGKTRQKLGASVSVGALCDEACTAAGSGKLVVKTPAGSGKSAARGKRTLKLKPASLSLAPGTGGTLKLKLSKARKAATAALAKGGSVRASVTVTATDASANAATQTRKVKLTARA
jgi:CSLREA domain-containing protein